LTGSGGTSFGIDLNLVETAVVLPQYASFKSVSDKISRRNINVCPAKNNFISPKIEGERNWPSETSDYRRSHVYAMTGAKKSLTLLLLTTQ